MNLSLYHLVREPKLKKEKNPLLLLLHGYGSNEEDLFSFAQELPEDYFVISARAPYPLPPYGNAWYAIHFDTDENKFSDNDEARASRDLIAAFIDELVENYPIDANNVTLVGFSQGTILSYSVALSYPEKVQRVVALSGYLNLDIVKENFQNNNIGKLKFFISHGTADQVIPVDWARKAPEYLKDLGLDVVYKEYPVGHGVAPQNFFDFKNWLE
ncbi:phospholipase/carboxylesterase [Flavobacterium limnosediminis JC2902]|uniref:Phospholipase/carboxylesterase n=1 Tax=Flavobacterium limnosediminis JC2902 TaxID=1341181 RepID=V6SPR2_9FLAO|nr:alpha/beta fold hydrolase [Flavobacterium limnosediminis]ESU28444.1 phospholipase/carboxylesterase [Flavobacterium limnosediminis JC2902]